MRSAQADQEAADEQDAERGGDQALADEAGMRPVFDE
jgi:hypothetical protein